MRRLAYSVSLLGIFVIPSLIIYSTVSDLINLAHLGVFVVSITTIGSLWDVWASRHGMQDRLWIWQFNKKNTLGVTIFDLPVEEYLFYVSSSVYVIFVWEGIKLGYATQSIEQLLILLGAAVWSLLFIGISFRMTGY